MGGVRASPLSRATTATPCAIITPRATALRDAIVRVPRRQQKLEPDGFKLETETTLLYFIAKRCQITQTESKKWSNK